MSQVSRAPNNDDIDVSLSEEPASDEPVSDDLGRSQDEIDTGPQVDEVHDTAEDDNAFTGDDKSFTDEVAPDSVGDETVAIDPAQATDTQKRRKPFRFSLKLLAIATLTYYFVVPLIPDFRNAYSDLRRVDPALLLLGLGLENVALWCYAPLMQAALGDAGHKIRRSRLYRIQMSTRAFSSIVPGGSAASTTLGYRLMTLSGVAGPDAGFALAAVGLGSALVLNVILWIGLLISIPIRGVNPIYGTVALVGVILMGIAAAIVFSLMEGQGRAETMVRWIARKLHLDPDAAAANLHRIAERLEQLLSEPRLLGRVVFWAALNWLLDCAALWVFLRAFGVSMDPDAIIIAFGIANVLAAIPITPGGLGYVDLTLITLLVGFGAPAKRVALGVPAYRVAQLFLPIITGGLLYLSLRVGPWKIERRDRLKRLRDLAEEETQKGESKFDFQRRFPTRDALGRLIKPGDRGAGSGQDPDATPLGTPIPDDFGAPSSDRLTDGHVGSSNGQ